MNILITGVHGFVGKNLVRSLGKQHSVYGVDIVAPKQERVVTTFSWNDLDKIGGMDAVIHLAGKAHDTENVIPEEEYFKVNVGLTKQIFDYFLSSGAKKFIFFSSVAAVTDRVEVGVLDECVERHPVGYYGKSKFVAEQYILEHWGDCRNQGQFVYLLRPSMIYGQGGKGNFNLLLNVVKRGWPWPLGAFENRRSFAAVENVCFAVDRLVDLDVESGVYHVADDEALSTNELIRVMCEAMEKKAKIWKINKTFMRGCAKAGTWFGLPLNEERLGKLTENFVVSNEKLKAALGVERMPVEAREGIRRTVKSFINN